MEGFGRDEEKEEKCRENRTLGECERKAEEKEEIEELSRALRSYKA